MTFRDTLVGNDRKRIAAAQKALRDFGDDGLETDLAALVVGAIAAHSRGGHVLAPWAVRVLVDVTGAADRAML